MFLSRLNSAVAPINDAGQCLLNMPNQVQKTQVVQAALHLSQIQLSNVSINFPGQCFSLAHQCQTIYGNMSTYCNGVS